MKSLIFWDVMQHRSIVGYRRFRATYWSHLQVSSSPRRMLDPWRQDWYVAPEHQ